MLILHGIKSCDSCRKARKFLDEQEVEYRFHDVREDGLNIQMLERWGEQSDWQQLLNKHSLTWRKIPEVDRASLTRDRAYALMLDNPTLVKRPILESQSQVTIGFNEDEYHALVNKD